MLRQNCLRRFVEYVPKNPISVSLSASAAASSVHEATARFRMTEAAAQRNDVEKANRGFFHLPKLNYAVEGGVSPIFSPRQLHYIYNVAHRHAVDTLNRYVIGTELEGHSLEAVVRASSFDATKNYIHTPACEHFNYCFFYQSVRPWGTVIPSALREGLKLQFPGSAEPQLIVQKMFLRAASTLQSRSGWVYLVWTGTKFDVFAFESGSSPLAQELTPLLGLSVHETSYEQDYSTVDQSGLETYISNFFKGCNWTVAARYYTAATTRQQEPRF